MPTSILRDCYTHKHFYTQTLLHTNTFTHKHFYTQTLLHTDAFTHRRFYTKKLLHAEAFTHFARQLGNRNFTSVFGDRTSFRAKGLRREPGNRNVTTQFWAIEPHFVRKGCAGQLQIAIILQFLTIDPHFVRKGCAGQLQIAILTKFLTIEPHFVRKGCAGRLSRSQFYLSFWRSNFISCEKVAPDDLNSQCYNSVFGDRTSFRAKGLRFVPSHWHCPASSREK